MKRLSNVFRILVRFLVLWIVDGFSLLFTVAIVPGFTLSATDFWGRLGICLSAAFLLGIVNLLIRPLILLVARPLGFIVLFIVGFFVNAISLLITAWLLPTFDISSLLAAFVGGLIFSAVNILITGLLEVDDEGSFYQGVIERNARRSPFAGAQEPGRGLVMLEIDGLSYHHAKQALAEGRMPEMQRLIDEAGYVLSRVDCGLPSQTSACQAGIMFGDNYDIPAFRWFDKDAQKLIVSSSDAVLLNTRYAKGNGLMRGGSSINNMLNGDAEKSLLTLADLRTADAEQKKRRAEDIYLLLLNPYFFTRTLVFFFVDVVRELWQAWQQQRKNVWPRLNRFKHGYPFVRAATTVLMRDIAANLAIMDIIRGAPSIYTTWPGYDEVAHHSGPWTKDAMGVLSHYDKVIGRVHRATQQKAPRPYDFVVLSDHGQSFGPTFKQRYGVSLKEFIEQHLPQGITVAQGMGGDTGVGSLTAVSGELENIQDQGVGGSAGRAVVKQSQKLVAKGVESRKEEEGATERAAQVTAFGSGNLAQVYFDLYPRKIMLSELNAAYPGMVDALLQHEGIGIVCGYEDDGTPVALGKHGKCNLHTGEVTGEDPLQPYAPNDPAAYGAASIETRVWQVRRVMDFPHAGDLMVISTVFPDGTVAALEELIGSHGGLGGEQTDAFIFHPPEMAVTPTRNSVDVYHILNARRGLPTTPADQGEAALDAQSSDEWSSYNLQTGLKETKTWLERAARTLVLEPGAYRAVANDPRMTAPGVLLGVVFVSLAGAAQALSGMILLGVAYSLVGWFFSVIGAFIAGRLLARKGYFTRTLRTMGFANVTYLFALIAFLPGVGALAPLLTAVVHFIASWIATAEAHETRGWRTLILPVAAALASTFVLVLLSILFGSALTGVDSVLTQLGLNQ